jgi:hypothetical protein
MQKIVCLASILVLLGAGAKPAKTSLGTFVRSILPMAGQNFGPIRGAKYDSDTYYAEYKPLPKALCTACKIYDQYARGKYPENWYVNDRWNTTWTMPKTEAYIRTQLGPVLSAFSLHRTVSYSYPTLTWRNSANGQWVVIDVYKDSFNVQVGRDLAKAVHVLNPPSKIQLQQLASGVSNLMRLALPDAVNNFASLRAPGKKKDILGEDSYPLNASFGSMFGKCDVSSVTNGYGFKDFQPKWVLNCDSISMAGTKTGLEEPLRAAIYDALPSGFTAVTDAAALLLDDYRWDNSDTMVSVNIGSNENKGVVSFNISIFHFLPKPT